MPSEQLIESSTSGENNEGVCLGCDSNQPQIAADDYRWSHISSDKFCKFTYVWMSISNSKFRSSLISSNMKNQVEKSKATHSRYIVPRDKRKFTLWYHPFFLMKVPT